MDDTSTSSSPPAPPAGSGDRRRRRIIAGAAIVAVLAAGVAVALVASSGSHHSASASAKTPGAPAVPDSSTVPGSSAKPSGGAVPSTVTTKAPSAVGSRGDAATVPTTKPAPAARLTTPTTARPGAHPKAPVKRGPVTAPPVPLSIAQAYEQGYDAECQSLWSQAGPSGELWDADSLGDPPHTIADCLSGYDVFNAQSWTDYTPADARAGGASDADTVADGLTVGNRLQNASGLVIYIPDPSA